MRPSVLQYIFFLNDVYLPYIVSALYISQHGNLCHGGYRRCNASREWDGQAWKVPWVPWCPQYRHDRCDLFIRHSGLLRIHQVWRWRQGKRDFKSAAGPSVSLPPFFLYYDNECIKILTLQIIATTSLF